MNEPLGREKSAPEVVGERRQVTALFYDIVGSTTLLNTLDPEDFGIAQRRVHSEVAAVLNELGGYLERVIGDGGCGYFGYPVPAEDAAQAAVSAALDIVERCRSLEPPEGTLPLQVRVGVATGIAVLSSTKGTSLPGNVEIIGLAPTLAARIQAEAEPNTVVISDSTHQLTAASFDFEFVGARDLKGFSEPQQLWRPVAKRAVYDRFSALRRPDTPLVARDDELDFCRRRWARANQGHGQAVFIVGEAGIGKSRLVAEVLRDGSGTDCDTHVFQCQPRANTRPLHPFLDRLRREISSFCENQPRPDLHMIREYISLTVPGVSEESTNMISFLLDGDPDRHPAHIFLTELSPGEFKWRAIGAAMEILSVWSRLRPQLLVIEDLHWADTLTQALLLQLLDEIKRLRVLLLVTTREPVAVDLLGDPHIASLALSRLDATAIPQVVAAAWSPSKPPPGLATFIEQKSDGVPLFVEELAHLFRARLSERASGPADWDEILRNDGVKTLSDLLSARIADLGEARLVAQVASVIGRDFGYELLARVFGDAMPARLLEEHLQVLVKHGIVRRRVSHEHLSFRFRHLLLQEAAYNSLLKSKRRELHDRVVRLVHEKVVEGPPNEIMAWHCEQAGRPLEAAGYAIRAGEACAIRSATLEADRLLKAAEDYLKTAKSAPEADELTLQLLAARGPVAIELFGKGSPEARAVYERGVAICHERTVQDRERWFPLYWGWWFTSPNRNTKRERSRALIEDLEQANDPEIRLQAHHCAWAANFHAANYRDCLQSIEKGLELYDPERARISRVRYGGHDAKVCALGERSHLLWLMGQEGAALEDIRAAIRWSEEIDHLGSKLHAIDYGIVLNAFQQDFAEVLRLSASMCAITEAHSSPGVDAKVKIFAGWARGLTGALTEGLREFEEGLAFHRSIGTDEDIPVYIDLWAQLLERAGAFQAGVDVLDCAITEAKSTGNIVWLPELYRRRALLRQQTNGLERKASLEDLERALSLAVGQGASTLAARVQADLQRLGYPLSQSHQ
jgi:predicted ATPase/class 3 adenylate cyclase